ncbi:MAG: sensor histidine kinase, partial [Candidatus Dormibacteraeota bacterium]|nr:sensor histidine kinase [Candidatus Dormibacteraeota bacterium]
ALLAGGLAGQALLIANHATWSLPSDPIGTGAVFAITYGTAGALVLRRRPGNPVARVFLYVTAGAVLSQLVGEYAIYAYTSHSDVPLRGFAAWLSLWTFFLAFPIGPTLIFLMFPDGLGQDWRGRAVAVTAILGEALLLVAYAGSPGPIAPGDRVANLTLPVDNPTGFLSTDLATTVVTMGWAASGLALVGAVIIAVVRLRRSTGERHQQLRWFAYFAAPVAPAFVLHFIIQGTGVPIVDFGFPVFYAVYLVGIPVAVGIALLKHRLYDLDVVISRTLVYGSLAVFITSVYVGIAVGIGALVGGGGKPNLGLSILATGIVAVGFQPVRERVQRIANRLVYGERATPYEVLAQFSDRVAESYAADDVMPRMARVLAEGTGAQRADVWVHSVSGWRAAAVWPQDAAVPLALAAENGTLPPENGASRMVEVRHRGDLLGALSVTKRTGEALTPVEENLLTHLAAQAGLVLKNVGLSSDLQARLVDLRASRQRLVTAQDEERRRLERNLHDGAQQHLVAIKVKLGLAEMLASRDPEKAKATIAQLKGDADEALETLRDLARGIYPPLLAEKGLGAALQSQARKATVPVTVDAEGIGRHSQEIEAAVYFSVLEALQNVQKYAHASHVIVRLREGGEELRFEVADDGDGFDVAGTPKGSGLINMADRLDALGGDFEVTSTVGRGTTLRGRLTLQPQAVPT